jgi:MFS family permease
VCLAPPRRIEAEGQPGPRQWRERSLVTIGTWIEAIGGRLAPTGAARIATSAIFFINGVAVANWLVRIPSVKVQLGASDGELGLALLGLPVGSLVAMPFAGWLVAQRGSRPVTLAMTLGLCASLPLPALAPSLALLPMMLALLGGFMGALDVAMNAQGAAVELRSGRPIMSSFHAAFSLGGMAGAVTGGLAAAAGAGPAWHLVAAAALLGAAGFLASRWLLPASADAVAGGAGFAWPGRAIAGLGTAAFCVLLAEGAMADWSAVYLHETVGTGPGLAASGYAAFSLAMAAGRLAGDSLAARRGTPTVLWLGGLVAATGLALALVVPQPATALVGFAAVGAGISFTFPLLLSAAARLLGIPPSVAIAAISTAGYLGFLAGPPAIDLGAELVSLRASLGLVVVLGALVALMAPVHPGTRLPGGWQGTAVQNQAMPIEQEDA